MTSLKTLFDEAMKKERREWCSTNGSRNSRSNNKTGFKWLCRINNNRYKKGYGWVYHRRINGKYISVYAADLFRLFEKVIARGYDWSMLDEERAKVTVESEGLNWNDFLEYTGVKEIRRN